jgi:hypothetical protein
MRELNAKQGLRPRLLLKPTLGSQGKGITLHANLSTLLRDTQRGWPCGKPLSYTKHSEENAPGFWKCYRPHRLYGRIGHINGKRVASFVWLSCADPAKDERFGGAASVSQQTAKQKRMGLYVVQSYIEPLLLHGRKFDIRMYARLWTSDGYFSVSSWAHASDAIRRCLSLFGCRYVLVASTEPVVLFWREGYIRRALQPYDPTAVRRTKT